MCIYCTYSCMHILILIQHRILHIASLLIASPIAYIITYCIQHAAPAAYITYCIYSITYCKKHYLLQIASPIAYSIIKGITNALLQPNMEGYISTVYSVMAGTSIAQHGGVHLYCLQCNGWHFYSPTLMGQRSPMSADFINYPQQKYLFGNYQNNQNKNNRI